MKVLLIHPYTDTDHTAGKYNKFLSPMPPISLAYVAAALEKAGEAVCIHDDFLFKGDDNALIKAVQSAQPDLVGLTCFTPNYPGVKRITGLIRKNFPGMKIVLGNIHADIFHEHFLKSGQADFIVHGEGEITVTELVKCLNQGENLREVQGISYLDSGTVVRTEPRETITDLDSLPFPAWHLFPFHRYKLFSFARLASPATLIAGTRGCSFKCNYCSLKIMGTIRRKRTVRNIVDEIQYLHTRYGIKQVAFVDPIFPLTLREAREFRNEMVSRKLHEKVVWTTETRVDLMNDELAALIREAGCRRVMFGFETGSDEMLESIEKHTTVAKARRASEICHRNGLGIIGFFMLGVPGETRESMMKTIQLSTSMDLDFAKYTVFVPYPGTDIYNDLTASGEITPEKDWHRYTSYPTREIPAIYTPAGLSNEDLILYQKKAFRTFYLRPGLIFRHLFRIRAFSLREIFTGLRLVLGLRQKPEHSLLD